MLGIGRGPGGAPALESVRPAMPDDEREAWIVLASVEGIGPVAFAGLVAHFGNARSVLEAARRPDGLQALGEADRRRRRRDDAVLAGIVSAAAMPDPILETVRFAGVSVVTTEDDTYPRRLLAVELPPVLLFVRGDHRALNPSHAVAVVGTRRPTDHGRRVASRIAGAIVDAGATVVSGLAVGIDGAAHAAAVTACRPTIAVLGGGHARLFPKAHERLAEEIVHSGGAVVSEMPPRIEPNAWTFPRRNRIVSGLADATVVVEAPLKSGALITASWALEQGRECFVVPGPLDARTSAGSLAFLRAHAGLAHLVASIPDLVEDLGLLGSGPAAQRSISHVDLGSVERSIVDALARGAATTDDLAAAAQQPIATVLGALTLLEMRGLIAGAYGRYHLAGRLAGAEVA
jgi:DNA processing protein